MAEDVATTVLWSKPFCIVIFSNDLIGAIEYPDKTTGQPGTVASEQQSFGYNQLGEKMSFTDQNGAEHHYNLDVMGRLTADIVETFGPGDPADQTVKSLGYTFNDAGSPSSKPRTTCRAPSSARCRTSTTATSSSSRSTRTTTAR
ncbi:MAG TPA: hypothetical protein VN541_12030 [Tepidisphaeraceae bacterium]|nr:hypothetical protein [Tepidisphaeraceae bacterium]